MTLDPDTVRAAQAETDQLTDAVAAGASRLVEELLDADERVAAGPGAPADTPEAEAALELCRCGRRLDGDLFHDVDELERPLCATCCPTCTADRAARGDAR